MKNLNLGKMLTVMLIVAVLLGGCILVKGSICDKHSFQVEAKIISMEYKDGQTRTVPYYNPATKTTMLSVRKVPAKYIVTLEYNGVTEKYDSEELYENYEVGENVTIEIVKKINKEGKIVSQYVKDLKN